MNEPESKLNTMREEEIAVMSTINLMGKDGASLPKHIIKFRPEKVLQHIY